MPSHVDGTGRLEPPGKVVSHGNSSRQTLGRGKADLGPLEAEGKGCGTVVSV